MNCEILRTLYVRANGEIPCNDDCGESIRLGAVERKNTWGIGDVFRNLYYQHLHRSLSQDWAPWGEICEKCAFFMPDEPFSDELIHLKIEKLQVEPSLYCDLACPCCTQRAQLRQREAPHLMPVEMFMRLLKSLAIDGYSVETVEFCGQGEPLKHPEFSAFLDLTRRYLPRTRTRLITNGNARFHQVCRYGFPDEIYVSCDGFLQNSYEKYRRNGSVELALNFMNDAKSTGGSETLLIWKYILFEFNDSDDELIAAQRKAMEMGIDEIQFVLTHSQYRSTRFTTETVGDIPLIPRIARVRGTPQALQIKAGNHQKNRMEKSLAELVNGISRQARRSKTLRHWFKSRAGLRKLRRRIETKLR